MAEVIRINENTWRIEDGMVRFFVLEGSDRALMIDSGMNTPDARSIAEGITDKPLELLNTHADRDHISGNAAFESCYMSPAEEGNFSVKGEAMAIRPIKDGDVIDLGNRPLRIIDIPGHTPGSVAILDVNARVLISGDSVQNGTIFMFGPFRDLKTYISSMEKLRTYEESFDVIYPSHGSFPVEKELTRKLIEGAKEILAGSAQGKEEDLFGNRVMHYSFPYAGFFCELPG
ncbi:MAG: MBL fold metallo-hydrolase [Lachnospiraceae bacterium]|nr:MBL fold metallo-hydrolase [Lachnospiraceae bacterium]